MADMPNLDDFSAIPEGPGPIPQHEFDWKKSNGVKISVAAGIVILAVLIFCFAFGVFGGKSSTTARNTGSTTPTPNTDQVTPPPPAPVTPPPPATDNTATTETPATPPTGDTPPGTAPGTTPGPGTSPLSNPGMMPPGYGPGMPPGYGQGMPPSTNQPGVNPLPDDITKWKKDDYLRARREGHPKLAEALFYASKNAGRNENSAQVFIELLKPIKAETNPDNPQGYNPPPAVASQQLIETIIVALAENGTKPAKDTLKAILSGDFPTDDDRSSVDALMKCMAFHPCDENDEILFQLLTQPESVRKPVAAGSVIPANSQPILSPSELLAKSQEMIKVSASEKLRLKLAEHFVKAGVEPNDQIMQFLLQEDPTNLGAQLALYRSEDLVADTKTKLEQYFLNYASLAIGLTMSVPSGVEGMAMGGAAGGYPGGSMPGYGGGPPPGYGGGMPPGYGGPPPGYGKGMPGYQGGYSPPGSNAAPEAPREKVSDVDRGIKLANALWTDPLVASLAEQLGDVRTMEKSAPTIVLASTFPLDSMRAAMYRMLKKKQLDGPQVLDAAGWADKVLNDPGTLVLVKMLNRKELKTTKGAPPRGPSYGGNPSPAAAKAEAQKKAENDWFEESRKLVGLWCSRFDAAAQAQRKAARKGTPIGEPAPTKPDDFEIPKEKDTKIEDAYQLNWPEKAPAGLASAKPGMLKIQYFHITQTGTIKKTLINFKRVMKNAEWHDTDKGYWGEIAPKITGASAPRRSIDVLITRQDKSAYDSTQKEDPTDLEIHILVVEIADPGASKE